ncbi:hypothetical protein SAMN02745121_07729 [Nannocystis exedens]|uniref:Tail specific protease domain-containing protein n=1 Tax=Nannocystis exedens TaxID=54 RepID=A0A1I2H8L7_9BACT|nr:hypothetical protein [Nannocystis exedens]PCC73983.1 hypothetical protein NAEX_07072 [Nannocystis exedens]SFF24961.1 hypothetical protein SAMN02745121_07729 [Nannocystis exedens]
MTRFTAIAAVVLGLVAPACKPERTATVTPTASAPASERAAAGGPLGTAEQRARLFAEIWDKTARREAFSPVKNQRLALDVRAGMEAFAPELLAAKTDVELFYALVKISNARKDRHLKVRPVDGGLVVPGWNERAEAPLRFAADYGQSEYAVFVADLDESFFAAGEYSRVPRRGDRVVGVDGRPFAEYVAAVEPYYPYSTRENFWWHLAAQLGVRSGLLPPDRFGERVTYELQADDGSTYAVTLPWLPPEQVRWAGPQRPVYPGMTLEFATETYELFRPTDGRKAVLLRWLGFRRTLVADVERLMAYAEKERLLAHALIVDATGSRGGSLGVYALQRMTGRPFKTTRGNIRLSDVVVPFVDRKRAEIVAGGPSDAGVFESDDGGARLLAWLEGSVIPALKAGRSFSEAVPFKLAHLPADSDGVVRPAPVHFSGPLVCFFGPGGGSHLDQFAATIIDNELGHTIGMPTGGFSNTWEWSEVLKMPGTERPLVEFMWSIGHTIRPNGEILEGNPAQVAERLPPTAANHSHYHALLLERAYAHLDGREERGRR